MWEVIKTLSVSWNDRMIFAVFLRWKKARLQQFREVLIECNHPEPPFPSLCQNWLCLPPLSATLQSDFHLGLTFGTYFMYRARSVARIALSIIFRVALYSSRERPLRIWFPWRERNRVQGQLGTLFWFWFTPAQSTYMEVWQCVCVCACTQSEIAAL